MTDADLIRFLDAQDQIYQQVVEELGRGRKQMRWMWFIFPQLAGSDVWKRCMEDLRIQRRQRWTGKQIAAETSVSPATVSRVLRRIGLNKLSALEPA